MKKKLGFYGIILGVLMGLVVLMGCNTLTAGADEIKEFIDGYNLSGNWWCSNYVATNYSGGTNSNITINATNFTTQSESTYEMFISNYGNTVDGAVDTYSYYGNGMDLFGSSTNKFTFTNIASDKLIVLDYSNSITVYRYEVISYVTNTNINFRTFHILKLSDTNVPTTTTLYMIKYKMKNGNALTASTWYN